jgi:signal transduction histidine kinase
VPLLRHPVAQFVAAGLLTLAVIAVGTGWLSNRAATAQARADARRTTEILARSVAEPALTGGLVAGSPGAVDRFDRAVRDRLLVGDVRRVKIWAEDGTVVYSDQTELIGTTYALGEDEQRVLAGASSEAEVSDLGRPENRFERGRGGLLEVYTRMETPGGRPVLFEVYYSLADVDARRQTLLRAFRPITLGGLLVFLALTTPVLWLLTKRLEQAGAEREQLLLRASDASDAERRRIARDLHDGVVQDLAATAFSLSAVARDPGTPPDLGARLEKDSASVRTNLRALRSLLVEIHPPDLEHAGLEAALQDLVAPAGAAGVSASVRVEGADRLSPETTGLVWRVAQEAVRNSLRHAGASAVEVVVDGTGDPMLLEVSDDGDGFEPEREAEPGHFGLRGLDSLARDAGGRVHVRSAPGAGTTVRLEVPRP